jgi:hypothetical protein
MRPFRGNRIRVLEQYRKLVTAQPAHASARKMGTEFLCNEDQDPVPCGVTVGVVDLLEMVDINQKQGKNLFLPRFSRACLASKTNVSRLRTLVRTSRSDCSRRLW